MRLPALAAVLLSLACGEAAFTPGAAPVVWQCPRGWSSVRIDSVDVCAPYEQGPLACGPGKAHFTGTPGCRRLETTCDRPSFRPVLVLEPGVHEGDLEIPNGVEVWGGCGPLPIIAGTVRVAGTATLSGVSIQPPSGPGLVLEGGAVLTVSSVEIAGAEGKAISMGGGRLDAQALIIRDTRRTAKEEGAGILGSSGAEVAIRHGFFTRNEGVALRLRDRGTTSRIEDVLVASGPGMAIGRGAVAKFSRVGFYENSEVAISADTDAEVVVEDVVVDGTRPNRTSGTLGFAVVASHGARVRVIRGWLNENRDLAVLAADRETSLRLEDVVVADTDGRGIQAARGADLELIRVAVFGARSHALRAVGRHTRLVASDLTTSRTKTGVHVDEGATAELESLDVRSTTALMAKAGEAPVHVTVRDARLEGVGRAVLLDGSVTFEAYRSRLLGEERVVVSGSGTRVLIEASERGAGDG